MSNGTWGLVVGIFAQGLRRFGGDQSERLQGKPTPFRRHAAEPDCEWEQDAAFRFPSFFVEAMTRVEPPPCGKLGRLRWDIAGALQRGLTWDEQLAFPNTWKPFRDFTHVSPHTHCFTSGAEPVLDGTGGFIGDQGTTKNVTEQCTAKHTERDFSVTVKIAAAMARLGAWSVELPGLQMTWCDRVKLIHGVSSDFECTFAEAIDFYAPEHREALRAAFAECSTFGIPIDLELQIITRGPRRMWVNLLGEAERNPSGQIVRVHGALQDITKSKEAAEGVRLMTESFAATLEGLNDGFYLLDREWQFRFVNAAAAHILHQSSESLIGKVIWDVLPETIGTRIQEAFQRVMVGGVPMELDEYCSPLNLWFQAKICPVPDGITVSFSDVTVQKTAEAQLIRSNAELEERVRERTFELEGAAREMEALAYAVAHDLRSPLSAICGYSQVLEQAHLHEMTGKASHYVKRIKAASTQMDEMTEGLLTLARLTGRELQRENVKFSLLAHEIAVQRSAQHSESKVCFQVESGITATADRVLLLRVLDNLIGNSCKFAVPDRATRIEIGRLRAQEGGPVYFVKDNGVGFDSAYASRLFQPFHRLHASGEFSGTGIGLSITQKVIRMHGGHIWAESSPGNGACFFFTLGLGDVASAHTRDLFSEVAQSLRAV